MSTDPFDFLNQGTPPGWPNGRDQGPINLTSCAVALVIFAAILLGGAFLAWRAASRIERPPPANSVAPDGAVSDSNHGDGSR